MSGIITAISIYQFRDKNIIDGILDLVFAIVIGFDSFVIENSLETK
jgi:uncharacterized membrane protein HdeD (DUF308 family)